MRVDKIDQLAQFGAALEDVRLLIVDEKFSADLLERPETYRAVNPEACIAVAYRDVEKIRDFFRDCDPDRHGPVGYIGMNAPLEVLLSSIRMLLHREFFLPAALVGDAESQASGASGRSREADDGAAELREKFARLTTREREVLRLVSSGQSNKAIARRLGITEHTVKLHNHNTCIKFGVSNRTAAAQLFFAVQRAGGDARV